MPQVPEKKKKDNYSTFSTIGFVRPSLVSVVPATSLPREPKVRTGDSSVIAMVSKADHIILITRLISFVYLAQSILTSREGS